MDRENTQLCPNCQKGYDTYLLDERSPFCPYLYLHDGHSCAMFQAIEKEEDKQTE